MKDDVISRNAAIKALHDEIVRRRIDEDTNDDGTLDEFDTEEILRRLPSAQPEQIARDIATIIENEQDMRVILKNAEHTETHSCDYQRTETHDLVSRRAAIEAVHKEFDECLVWDESGKHTADEVERILTDVPSAQPYTEEEIQAMQDLEQAQLDKAYQIGMESAQPESRREWYMHGYRDAQKMHESCTDCPLYDHDRHNCPRFNKVIPRTIEEVKPRWISVTEALPEYDFTDVLICLHDVRHGCEDDYYIIQAYTVRGHWKPTLDINIDDLDVVAWMPLPEPMRETE